MPFASLPSPAHTHPAAHDVAAHVRAALERRTAGGGRPAIPDAALIAAVLDVAFWGSLRREEGASPRVSLAFLSHAEAGEPLTFRRRLPLTAASLAHLAPAVERPGIHLGVARGAGGALALWGTTRRLPAYTLVLEVVAPGLLVLKYRPADGGKFVNLVVLEGDRVKIVDQGDAARLPDCPTPLALQFGLDGGAHAWTPMAEVLVELAVSMRAHGRGGTLLVVPGDDGPWRASLVRTNPYRVAPPYSALGLPARAHPDAQAADAIEAIAGLTAVDGATVLSAACHVLAFGAKIVRRPGNRQVRHVLLSAPSVGYVPERVPATQLGGTRHLSAAQFVGDQRDALAMVASQDGLFTVFTWLDAEGCVSARRVESLLI
jgi:hypothetical protein